MAQDVLTNLLANLIWALGAFLLGSLVVWFLARRKVSNVRFRTVKVEGPELERVRPKVLIATFSGLRYDPAKHGTADDFRGALQRGDWQLLDVSVTTLSIGHTLRAIATYKTLERVYLITSTSPSGLSSLDSAELVKSYVKEELGRSDLLVLAEPRFSVLLDDDSTVAQRTFEIVRDIFQDLGPSYKPKKSGVLVDITGGVRGMVTGALLACLRPDQDAHLIGSRYDESGRIVSSFPMLVSFEPEKLRWGT